MTLSLLLPSFHPFLWASLCRHLARPLSFALSLSLPRQAPSNQQPAPSSSSAPATPAIRVSVGFGFRETRCRATPRYATAPATSSHLLPSAAFPPGFSFPLLVRRLPSLQQPAPACTRTCSRPTVYVSHHHPSPPCPRPWCSLISPAPWSQHAITLSISPAINNVGRLIHRSVLVASDIAPNDHFARLPLTEHAHLVSLLGL